MSHDLRAMLDAIGYVTRYGMEWRALPVDFPPWSAVYAFVERWSARELPRRLADRLRGRIRIARGRSELPTAAVIDAQTIPGADTVPAVSAPNDLGCQRHLQNLDELQAKARAINARLLHAERVGQGCHLANPVFERTAHPTVTTEGRRASAMRFGDSRVQALAGALSVTLCAVTGITNWSLRAPMTGLLGTTYGITQASYDLARLRHNGLIARRPHTNTYDLTADGLRFAIFYTKVHDRVLAPLFTADQPQAPPELRTALHPLDQHINDRLAHARLSTAA
jgi:transposase